MSGMIRWNRDQYEQCISDHCARDLFAKRILKEKRHARVLSDVVNVKYVGLIKRCKQSFVISNVDSFTQART